MPEDKNIEKDAKEAAVIEKYPEINQLQLKGFDVIQKFSKELKTWDPRIVAASVRGISVYDNLVAHDQQQQQQQQQQKG